MREQLYLCHSVVKASLFRDGCTTGRRAWGLGRRDTECTALPLAALEKSDASLKYTLKKEIGIFSAKRVPIPCINIVYR